MQKSSPLQINQQKLKNTLPSLRYTGAQPFSSWQATARNTLHKLLGMDTFRACTPQFCTEYDREEGEYREIRFSFQSEEGYFVPCHLLIPAGATKPLPLMVCLQGHSTGMHISLGRMLYDGDEQSVAGGDRDFALQAIREGFCAVTIEQRNFGECGGTPRPNCQHSSMLALLTGHTTIAERIWDVQRLLDILPACFPQIDPGRIYCMGNSGGGTTTIYLSCLEERIAAAMPSCAFSTFDASLGEHGHCTCNFIPGIARYFDMGDLMGMLAPRPLVVVSGQADEIFPIAGAREMFRLGQTYYTAANASDNCRHVIGTAGHRFYAAAAWPVFHALTD